MTTPFPFAPPGGGGISIASSAYGGRGTRWELRALNPQILSFEDWQGGPVVYTSPFRCIVGGDRQGPPPTYPIIGPYMDYPAQVLSYIVLDDAQPYLRMSQRDDGLGISGHPRLPAAQGSTSEQSSLRVGGLNTYE